MGQSNEAIQAAAETVVRHGSFIRAVIRFQAGGRLDEEDLFQEFYLALIRRPIPADVRNVKSFLYRTVLNHVIDAMRRDKYYRHFLKKYAREARISVHNPGARNAFIEAEKGKMIAYCVRHLRERQAQAFVLRYRDNYDIAEIAQEMRVAQRTVSRYLSEGLRRLQRVWAVE